MDVFVVGDDAFQSGGISAACVSGDVVGNAEEPVSEDALFFVFGQGFEDV